MPESQYFIFITYEIHQPTHHPPTACAPHAHADALFLFLSFCLSAAGVLKSPVVSLSPAVSALIPHTASHRITSSHLPNKLNKLLPACFQDCPLFLELLTLHSIRW